MKRIIVCLVLLMSFNVQAIKFLPNRISPDDIIMDICSRSNEFNPFDCMDRIERCAKRVYSQSILIIYGMTGEVETSSQKLLRAINECEEPEYI